jgi:hypothetical protein
MNPLSALAHVVAPKVIDDAIRVGRLLAELGVPHALVGGLAVGLHGHPRATRDVDYMVGAEAFEATDPLLVYRAELKEHIRVGVIDLLAVPVEHPWLAEELGLVQVGEIHVISVEGLIEMKLLANRGQDREDVRQLLAAGADPAGVAAYLAERTPELLVRFSEIVG